jgi:hypothetical protein
MPKILLGIPKILAREFKDALYRHPFQASAGLAIEIDVEARLGCITEGAYEKFVPLIIENILGSRFNPEPAANDPKDMPPFIYNMRDRFIVK